VFCEAISAYPLSSLGTLCHLYLVGLEERFRAHHLASTSSSMPGESGGLSVTFKMLNSDQMKNKGFQVTRFTGNT